MNLCKICFEKTRTIRDKKKNIVYYRCCNCGFVSLENSAIVDSITEKKHYAKHNNSFESTGYVEMFERFIKEGVEPYLLSVKRVLDFGCGHTPVLAELLKRKALDVDIYDYYFYPEKRYETRQYDMIVSTEVFEHLSDPISILQGLVNSLDTKGYILLMTQFPTKDDIEFLEWWYRRDITHISFFTPKSFELMAERVGLKVVKLMNDNIVVFQKVC